MRGRGCGRRRSGGLGDGLGMGGGISVGVGIGGRERAGEGGGVALKAVVVDAGRRRRAEFVGSNC